MNNNVKNFISFDLSTTSTGWAYFLNGNLEDHGTIKISNYKYPKYIERVCLMGEATWELIKKRCPSCCVFEEIPLYTKGKHSVKVPVALGAIRGAIEMICFFKKIPCYSVNDSTWRKSVGISLAKGTTREDKKNAAIEMVQKIYGILRNDDEAEAILIGKYYLETGGIT